MIAKFKERGTGKIVTVRLVKVFRMRGDEGGWDYGTRSQVLRYYDPHNDAARRMLTETNRGKP